MKALELLKEIRNMENDYDHLKTHKFDEAIEELENLKDKSCEGCISYMIDIDGFSFCNSYEKDLDFNCSRGYWLEDNYTKF